VGGGGRGDLPDRGGGGGGGGGGAKERRRGIYRERKKHT